MAQRIHIGQTRAEAVYDDRFVPLLKALGSLKIERASTVEFDSQRQLWVATYLKTGEVIAEGENRDQVIKNEVAWLEKLYERSLP